MTAASVLGKADCTEGIGDGAEGRLEGEGSCRGCGRLSETDILISAGLTAAMVVVSPRSLPLGRAVQIRPVRCGVSAPERHNYRPDGHEDRSGRRRRRCVALCQTPRLHTAALPPLRSSAQCLSLGRAVWSVPLHPYAAVSGHKRATSAAQVSRWLTSAAHMLECRPTPSRLEARGPACVAATPYVIEMYLENRKTIDGGLVVGRGLGRQGSSHRERLL